MIKLIKQVIKVGIVSLLFLIVPSCSEFLVENPKDQVFITNYYQTEQDAIEAVNSIYGYLNGISVFPFGGVYFDAFWTTIGEASDEMQNEYAPLTDNEQIENFNFGTRNGNFLQLWGSHYKTIYVANLAIDNIPGIKMDENLKSRLTNEAKFLRALMYFNLVRMYGSIPLVLHSAGQPLKPDIAAVDDIYNQIILDLTDAENLPDNYPAGNGLGRATKWAAKGLLAKVYLTLHEYQKAADKSFEVINSHQFELWDNYADVFKLANRGGKEAIFSVGFGDASGAIIFWEEAGFNVRLLPLQFSQPQYKLTENTHGWTIATDHVYQSFEAGDERKDVTIVTDVLNVDGTTDPKRYIRKYWDNVAEPKGQPSAQDFPVLRYSDILLMYSEASNELGNVTEAYNYINIVRNRANVSNLPVGLSKDDFRMAILKERLLEFVCEGQRWFDLVRTGTLETLVPVAKPGILPQSKNYLFPIPETEVELNPNLKKNDSGYY